MNLHTSSRDCRQEAHAAVGQAECSSSTQPAACSRQRSILLAMLFAAAIFAVLGGCFRCFVLQCQHNGILLPTTMLLVLAAAVAATLYGLLSLT